MYEVWEGAWRAMAADCVSGKCPPLRFGRAKDAQYNVCVRKVSPSEVWEGQGCPIQCVCQESVPL